MLKTSRSLFCGSPHHQSSVVGVLKCCVVRRGWRKLVVSVRVSNLIPPGSCSVLPQLYSTDPGDKDGKLEKKDLSLATEASRLEFSHKSPDANLYFNKEIQKKIRKKLSEQYFIYTENIFMDVETAKREYLLDDSDLVKISQIRRKSPYSSSNTSSDEDNFITVVWKKDVEKIALDKWKSKENLERQKMLETYKKTSYTPRKEEEKTFSQNVKAAFGKDSGAVVVMALMMNICNVCVKGAFWIMTGSPSMFSEFMHSCGDVMNQLFLVVGRYLSMKNPDESHPYGYRNHIHIWSILSGMMIFSLGCGCSLYNGVLGVFNPVAMDYNSLYWSLWVLLGTFITESASLAYAVHQISKDAKAAKMSFVQYVKEGDDPLCNVVLLEDLASVLGVGVCALAITASYSLGIPVLDAAGSLLISCMMGGVSYFLFQTNVEALLGKSLPYEREITKYLESDRFINAVLDNKTLDMGNQSRFKTEIVLDAQLITRHFLDTEVDLDAMLVKWRAVKTVDDMSQFLEEFGCEVYDQIVAHVDRKEYDIKKKFPEIRHIDIEPS